MVSIPKIEAFSSKIVLSSSGQFPDATALWTTVGFTTSTVSIECRTTRSTTWEESQAETHGKIGVQQIT